MRKELIFIVMSVVMLFGIASPIAAQNQDDEYKEALNKMLLISGSFATMETMIPQSIELMRKNMPGIPESYLKAFSDGMITKVKNRMVEVFTPIYQKHLSLDDLKQIIAFYESPIGSKLGTATPLISKESMEVGQKIGMEIVTEIQQTLQSYDK